MLERPKNTRYLNESISLDYPHFHLTGTCNFKIEPPPSLSLSSPSPFPDHEYSIVPRDPVSKRVAYRLPTINPSFSYPERN